MLDKWRNILFGLAVVLLVAAGWLDQTIRGHWQNSSAIQQAVADLELLPNQLHEWVGEPVALDEIVVQIAACSGYKAYRYTNQRTGNTVDVTVMVGIPGQLAEHTPESCYAAGGYTMVRSSWQREPATTFLGEAAAGNIVHMDFVRGDHPRPIRVWHAWFDGTQWSRPDYPRLTFATSTVLCKLQVASVMVPDYLDDEGKKLLDPGKEFLDAFLPRLTDVLLNHQEPAAEESGNVPQPIATEKVPS